jgi:uncharacterized protein (TIGR00375 family)
MALGINEKAILIPAHAWTPWFSLYGFNSGFDSIEECFGDLSDYIYAVETGLSSDPEMNGRIKELDSRSIVSFSDAHSAPKMGREATIFDCEMSFSSILNALKRKSIAFTIEFFPEEGKYHFDGHRNCDLRQSPEVTIEKGIICPRCKRKLTVGVLYRVNQLADKERGIEFKTKEHSKFKRLVPLLEILSESFERPITSPKVTEEYKKLINRFGSELEILLKSHPNELSQVTTERVVEGLDKVRKEDIVIEPGFDGVYGVVRIWPRKTGVKTEGKVVPIKETGQGVLF